jgi:ADP-ribose pyrophosphatase YjhB (NUDIX family)
VADKDALGKRGRSLEEEYFRRQDQELIEKLRARGSDEAARRALAERTGVADEEILAGLQAIGYTPDTVQLLHLVPLVQVAWAEGGVSDRERQLIVEAARAHGVEPGSAADARLGGWLDERPSDEFFERTLRAAAAILESQPEADRQSARRNLVAYSTAVASASGGLLGFGRVSESEREVLSRISAELEAAHAVAAGRVVQAPDGT